jgi:3-phenylpropionate/trans-cinnamate dioxygenase ferredoxin reductase subunit
MSATRFVIVGAGLAGASAAFALRKAGFDGEVTLLGQEAHPPYNRPSLSKEYLRGEDTLEDLFIRPLDAYARQGISLRSGERVVAIDAVKRMVELAAGTTIPYDRLLVATGARPRTLEVPGAELPGISQLRTIEDADRITAVARRGSRVVVAGMGFIGSEIAAALHQRGALVTVVEASRTPLGSVLHRERGVELLLRESVAAFEGHGRLERVRTSGGRIIECEMAVVGIGVEPESGLLAAAGAATGRGVLVDSLCRTSLPDVYAAGDVADTEHPVFGRSHVEHWNNALRQGEAAARSMLGSTIPYAYIHSFWSDQYDHSLEYVGLASDWDNLVFRGQPSSHRFLGFYLRQGRLQAVVGLDRGGDPEDQIRGSELKKCIPLIAAQAQVDPIRLADEDCLLKDASR